MAPNRSSTTGTAASARKAAQSGVPAWDSGQTPAEQYRFKRVLVVDDDRPVLELIRRFLHGAAYDVVTAETAEQGLAVLYAEPIDVVITDLTLTSMAGLDFLDELLVADPDRPFIVITGFGTVDTAVAAMKKGAIDYLTKPLHKEQLLVVLEKAARQADMVRELRVLRRQVGGASTGQIIGSSKKMRDILEMASRIAPSNASVMIQGQSGTGKELLAREIHRQSTRADGPFLAINCGAFTETLLESELFGHVRGAFTGAVVDHKGVFEAAGGGTIFLDEIGDISPAMQVKLLRVLQEREIKPVGATDTRKVDIRVVSATHRNIRDMVREGTFREDLFFRVAVVTLEIPSLRERAEDIPLMIPHFYERIAARLPAGSQAAEAARNKSMNPDALALLMRYPWPGNVRELENAVEHAILMSPGNEIAPAHLPPEILGTMGGRLDGVPLTGTLREALDRAITLVEVQVIRKALRDCGGNKVKAAERLGISRASLYNKLKRYKIER